MAKRRASGRMLTPGQETNLKTGRNTAGGIGPDGAFETEEERREAWEDHKERLLAESRAGRRPAAFWDYYEGGDPRKPNERHLQALYRLDLLSEDERRILDDRGLLPPPPYTGGDPRDILADY